jgi:hypothetical protein
MLALAMTQVTRSEATGCASLSQRDSAGLQSKHLELNMENGYTDEGPGIDRGLGWSTKSPASIGFLLLLIPAHWYA